MAIIDGTPGNDTLDGTIGNDVINGLDGNDIIVGRGGTDTINGGAGADSIYGGAQGDTVHGGAGNDIIRLADGGQAFGEDDNDDIEVNAQGSANTNITAHGGLGDDRISVSLNLNVNVVGPLDQSATVSGGAGADEIFVTTATSGTVDGGDDNDLFLIIRNLLTDTGTLSVSGGNGDDDIRYRGEATGLTSFNLGAGADWIWLDVASGPVSLTLGSGQDVIEHSFTFVSAAPFFPLTVTDFAVGDAGDRFDLLPWLNALLTNWDHSTNPFSTGHIRARQSGADTIIEVDLDGGGNGYSNLAVLQNVTATALTAFNIAGYKADGSVTPGQTINGTPEPDELFGTTGNDTINGQGDYDIINAGPGDDEITDAIGGDMIYGEGGNDTIIISDGGAHGGWGDDIITSSGPGLLYGDDGNDILTGGNVRSTLEGGLGFDTVTGGSAEDWILMSDADWIDGGGGSDNIRFDLSQSSVGLSIDLTPLWTGGVVTVGSGSILNVENPLDYIGSAFDDVFIVGAGAPANFRMIQGGGGNDILTGSNGRDTLVGGEGNDTLTGLGGPNSLYGNAGDDELTGGADAEFLYGESGDDTINGGDGADSIYGDVGNDILNGGAGDDTIDGWDGVDQIDGGSGNDTIRSGLGGGIVFGGDGNDSITILGNGTIADAGAGDDVVTLYAAASIAGGGGTDTLYIGLFGTTSDATINLSSLWLGGGITYSGGTIVGIEAVGSNVGLSRGNDIFVVGDAGPGFGIVSGDGNDIVIGGNANDSFVGGNGNDTLAGHGGNDRLEGGTGLNELIGSTGNDIYVVTNRTDSTVEYAGEGLDTVETTIGIYALQANVENLTFTDHATHGAGVGNMLDNVINGGDGIDDLYGRAGNDTLNGWGSANTLLGQEGDDVYFVVTAGDSVIEFAGQGNDTVRTTLSAFVLRDNVENLIYAEELDYFSPGAFTGIGADNANSITGGSFDDFLSGLGGDDILFSKSGADILLGGAGADQFRYAGGEAGIDRILDFTSGSDKIALSTTGYTHTGVIGFIQGAGAGATEAVSTFLYDTVTGIVSFDADGNGAGAAVRIAQLNAGLSLSATDFVFY